MLKVYYADISGLDDSGEYPLSEYRRSRMRAQRLPERRTASCAAELLLIHALREYRTDIELPLDIGCGKCGKPALRGEEVFFSLSHSGRMVSAAVCDRETGVDIQQSAKYEPAVVKRFFARDEQAYIEAAEDKDAAYTRIWCMKESYIKAVGTGMHIPLNSFSVMDFTDVWHCTLDGYTLAVCVPGARCVRPDSVKRLDGKELLSF